MSNKMGCAGLFFVENKNLCAYIICGIGNDYSINRYEHLKLNLCYNEGRNMIHL